MKVERFYEVEIQEQTFRMTQEEAEALYSALSLLVGQNKAAGFPVYPPGVRGIGDDKKPPYEITCRGKI